MVTRAVAVTVVAVATHVALAVPAAVDGAVTAVTIIAQVAQVAGDMVRLESPQVLLVTAAQAAAVMDLPTTARAVLAVLTIPVAH